MRHLRMDRVVVAALAAALLTAVPAAAGIDWGLCPAPGVKGDTIGTDRYVIEASSSDDSASGGSACTLRDAILSVEAGSAGNGCSLATTGTPSPGDPWVIVLQAYTYTLDGSELTWTLDVEPDSYALCGHGPAETTVRAAGSPATTDHRVLALDGTGHLRIYGVGFTNGVAESIIELADPDSLGGPGGDGGGLLVAGLAFADLYDVALFHNLADGNGGGLACIDRSDCFRMERGVVINNVAAVDGGGLHGRGDIRSSYIAQNAAGDDGGGFYSVYSTPKSKLEELGDPPPMLMENTWLNGNTAVGRGGGWFLGRYGVIDGVTASSNTALQGGGIYVAGPYGERMHNLTLAVNTAEPPSLDTLVGGGPTDPLGGGLFVSPISSVTLYNATITNNRIDPGGPLPIAGLGGDPTTLGAGLHVEPKGSATYAQSFIGGNLVFTKGTPADDCFGGVSADYNLGGVGCDVSETNDGIADPADVMFLTDWGGAPGRELPIGGFLNTVALVGGGDPVDGGPTTCVADFSGVGGATTLPLDARGFERRDGDNSGTTECDIGAFEYKGNPAIWIDGFDDAKQPPCNWSVVVDPVLCAGD